MGALHGRFDARRRELLAARARRGAPAGFLDETRAIRQDDAWTVAPPRPDYGDRRVEITGPADRKLVINALNSGARGFMADFEDATAPTWHNVLDGQANLIDAIDATITHEGSDGRHYALADQTATLLVRPRGWHLPERHVRVDGEPAAGALVDFGLYAFPQRPAAAGPRLRRLPVPAQARAPPRGAPVERRLHVHRGRARPADRHDPRHRADRDAAGRV